MDRTCDFLGRIWLKNNLTIVYMLSDTGVYS